MRFLTAAAAAVLLTASAMAQQSPSVLPESQPPGNKGGAPGMAPANTTDRSSAGATMSQSADASHFQTNQGGDQWLVGNLWHKSIYNASGQAIGDLNDIVIDKDGKIASIVIGVGGFLGLGEKNVAVNFDQLQRNGGVSPNRLVLNMSEQDLRNAPAFTRNSTSSSNSMSR
jgi:sporulation protein YlmC with PRC-barrel domain